MKEDFIMWILRRLECTNWTTVAYVSRTLKKKCPFSFSLVNIGKQPPRFKHGHHL